MKIKCLTILAVLFLLATNTFAFDNLVYSKEKEVKLENVFGLEENKSKEKQLPIKPDEVSKSNKSIKSKKDINKKVKKAQEDTSKVGDIFLWISIGLSLTSLIFTLFISLIIGLGLILVSLLFLILGFSLGGGKKKNKNTQSSERNSLKDMVHLKNGSIIKCEIVEQVVGESIKIKTSDGSILVYKMDEVLKITKDKE